MFLFVKGNFSLPFKGVNQKSSWFFHILFHYTPNQDSTWNRGPIRNFQWHVFCEPTEDMSAFTGFFSEDFEPNQKHFPNELSSEWAEVKNIWCMLVFLKKLSFFTGTLDLAPQFFQGHIIYMSRFFLFGKKNRQEKTLGRNWKTKFQEKKSAGKGFYPFGEPEKPNPKKRAKALNDIFEFTKDFEGFCLIL